MRYGEKDWELAAKVADPLLIEGDWLVKPQNKLLHAIGFSYTAYILEGVVITQIGGRYSIIQYGDNVFGFTCFKYSDNKYALIKMINNNLLIGKTMKKTKVSGFFIMERIRNARMEPEQTRRLNVPNGVSAFPPLEAH